MSRILFFISETLHCTPCYLSLEREARRSEGVKGQDAAEGLEVCGVGRATADQGGAGGMKEPGGVVRTMG